MSSRAPSPSSSSSRISMASPRVLDIDRYRIDGELRDYIVAARELSPNSLTGNQTDWINRHTVYTHGNGFVAAPANRVNAAVRDAANTSDSNSGYPIYTVSDIASQGSGRQIIPVDQPRIYYGEVIAQSDPDYAIVGGARGVRSPASTTPTPPSTPTPVPAVCPSETGSTARCLPPSSPSATSCSPERSARSRK